MGSQELESLEGEAGIATGTRGVGVVGGVPPTSVGASETNVFFFFFKSRAYECP